MEKGGKLIPFAGVGVGAALAFSEAKAGNYAAAVVEAAGASEVPILAQVADGGSLAAEIAWVVKDVLDPEQEMEMEMEGWYYRTFLQ